MSTIARTGKVVFHDASLSVWEDGISDARRAGGHDGATQWERQFKRDVFSRIIQQLNRLGWTCRAPDIGPHDIKHYGGDVARSASERRRFCTKGDLKADLEISGRHIEFKMFQSVHCPTRPDHEGRYEWNKEQCMPYVLRLEMERTRRRIRDYLCGVFDGYEFNPPKRSRGFGGMTAMDWIRQDNESCWHYKPELGRRGGEDANYNNKSADGAIVRHGQRVWFYDHKGRLSTGTAYYNINNMWWVVTGKYDVSNEASFDLYTACPENPRIKRNSRHRRNRLEGELAKAIKAMNFERAATVRDLLFPKSEPLFVVWHKDHGAYHRAGFSGYANDIIDAGKFTAAEVKGWDGTQNEVRRLEAA